MSKQLFLTSSVHAVAHDIAQKVDFSKGKRLVFIDTAAEVEEGDKQWLRDDRQALVTAGFEVSDYTITGKTAQQLRADLTPYDFLYLSGGNTLFLLQEAQRSGFIPLIQELVEQKGKTYIGTSAGSIIAGPDIYPTHRLENEKAAPDVKGYEGFGLVNFCIFPHWGSAYFKDLYLNRRLEHSYSDASVPLVILTDTQYVHVSDDQLAIIDVKKLES